MDLGVVVDRKDLGLVGIVGHELGFVILVLLGLGLGLVKFWWGHFFI